MRATTKPLLSLTAADLMTRDLLRLAQQTPLREAARLLFQSQVSGAPVVDVQGRCVGVLSAADFVRLVKESEGPTSASSGPLPLTCPFLAKHQGADGAEKYLCTLPPGACPIQVWRRDPAGNPRPVCSQPHAVPVDWQIVEVENLPEDAVARYMTADPVTAAPEAPIYDLARRMTDAHVHRVIVVDEDHKPVGIVSSTDVLAAVAHAGNRQETTTESG